jgi:enamine deaminase RidA (YjgF/YER057c/UK114 family)
MIEERLKELGYELKAAPAPAANYLPWRISGNQLFLSGVLAMRDGEMTHIGQVGTEQTVESGYEAARVCALNVLAGIKGALGSLDRVKQFLIVNGFVNAVAGFADSPQVINGASDFLVEVFGDAGRHARAAVAVAGLPKGSTVELQVIVEFE